MDEVEYRLLRHTWFPVARSEDVGGNAVAANILGEDLVVFSVDGKVTVAEGRCPHRGVALWLGQVRDGGLECPYHGWRFAAGTGQCTHVPSLPAGEPLPRVCLRTYPVRQAYGHVWTCLQEPYLPLPELPLEPDAGWAFGHGVPHDLRCGVRQLTENFRDISHFPFVHGTSMGAGTEQVVAPYRLVRDGWRLEWTMRTRLGGTALDGNEALANEIELTHAVSLPMAATIRTRFPDGGRRFLAQFATPISDCGQRVRLFWTLGIDRVVQEQHGVPLPQMMEYEQQIFAEDYPIVENQRPAEAPLDLHSQVHTRADRYSILYRRMYAELLRQFETEQGQQPPAPVAQGARGAVA